MLESLCLGRLEMNLKFATIDLAKADEVNAELAHQWNLLRTDNATREIAGEMGIDLALVDQFEELPLTAEPAYEGNRADVVTTILIGVAVGLAKDALKEGVKVIWTKLIKPEIEKRFGKSKELESNSG